MNAFLNEIEVQMKIEACFSQTYAYYFKFSILKRSYKMEHQTAWSI